jgi:hypothetical protein
MRQIRALGQRFFASGPPVGTTNRAVAGCDPVDMQVGEDQAHVVTVRLDLGFVKRNT